MEKLRLAVVGSRSFNDYALLKETLDKLKGGIALIVSGGANGADKLAERWAKENNIKTLIFPANWDDLEADGAVIRTNKFGKKYNANAGFARNKTIIENCDAVLAFWDMKSRGTKDGLDYAKKIGKKRKIVSFEV